MQLIPAIDLLGDDAVRLEQGDYDRVLFRLPLEEFLSRVVATGPELIHVVDLQGARDGALRTEVIARCARLAGNIPLQVSGGIRSLDALGERLVAALDVRDGQLAVRGWLSGTGLDVDQALARCRAAGVTRLHVTAIARDGTMNGPDLDLYEKVCASGLKVVAAGGVRGDADLAVLEALGCEAAVMGVGFLARLGISF